MVDLIVIGSGYWGSAVAIRARAAGLTVRLLDDGRPGAGSRAASGIADRAAYKKELFKKYLPSDWSTSELDDSFDWLLSNGGFPVREWFWNRFAGTVPRRGDECVYVPDCGELTRRAGPVTKSKVKAGCLEKSGVTVGDDSGGEWAGKAVVVAAGVWTDDVLRRFGVKPVGVGSLYGRGLVADGKPRHPVPVSVMIRPYTKHTVREWNGRFKIGDTAERVPSPKKLEALRSVGRIVLDGYTNEEMTEGYRPVTDKFMVEKLSPRLIVATGGHRIGLGLAGLVSNRVMEALK